MDPWTDTTNNLINELSEGTLSESVDAIAGVLRLMMDELHRLREKDAARDSEFRALAEKDETREAAMASLRDDLHGLRKQVAAQVASFLARAPPPPPSPTPTPPTPQSASCGRGIFSSTRPSSTTSRSSAAEGDVLCAFVRRTIHNSLCQFWYY